MQVIGAVIQQLLHELVGARVHHMLVVVDDQEQLFVDRGGAFDNRGDDFIDQLLACPFQRDAAVQHDAQALQGAAQISEEDRQVLVIGAQRQPGHLGARAHHHLPPLGQQCGLAEPGTAGNQAHATL
ncbi:hypothetical protein D3C76_1392220 [compost metagenome]